MRVHLLTVQPVTFFFQHHQRPKLIGPDIIEADWDAQLQRSPDINGLSKQQAGFGRLCGVQPVERAPVTAAIVIGCVRT
jgi:hypothetical protein